MYQIKAEGNPWFVRPNPSRNAKLRLFCFSHAGGAASAYHAWQAALDDVEVWAVQLPGREARVQEPLISDLQFLAQKITDATTDHLNKPFIFLGHSMGAVVAYETARELNRRGLPLPLHLYVSGRPAPHLPPVDPPLHDLPDAELLFELKRRFDGLPKVILAEPDLLALFLPILRSDLKMMETHQFLDQPRLSVSLSAYCGQDDRIMNPANLAAWADLTSGVFHHRQLPGGHFYLHDNRREFLSFFSGELDDYLNRLS
jgi:medium-chain acyl-[acyl-carrier-protein] hydrolase